MASVSTDATLDKALVYVSQNWLPPQPYVLARIQQRLAAGDYEDNRDKLLKDLKDDFSLYLYCLREFSATEPETGAVNAWGREIHETEKKTPAEVLQQTPLFQFRRILCRPEQEISSHSIAQMNKLQMERLRESILSASSAEVLAESLKVDREAGFSCAIMRQLGLALIAWNYPQVYARTVGSLKPGVTLDESLKKVLGFSPSLLGLSFARRWNLADDVLVALGDKQLAVKTAFKNPQGLSAESVGVTLAKVCEVSEALARANHPETYPTALADWETAQEVIAQQLGPKGIQAIYERSQQYLSQYAQSSPEITTFVASNNTKEQLSGFQFSNQLLEKNVHLKQVPEPIRREIREFYARLQPKQIIKSNVVYFINELVPKAGFGSACIYMYDPEKRSLSPSIKFGKMRPEQLRPVKISSAASQFELIASAYVLKTPLREEHVNADGQNDTMIAGALGAETRVGVLYLETKADFVENYAPDPMPVFRALRQALADCLNLI